VGDAYMNRNGNRIMSQVYDEDGVQQLALFESNGDITMIPSVPEAGSCVGTTNEGPIKSSLWHMDDSGKKAVGFTYVDYDGDGVCPQRKGEIVPFVWTEADGMQLLDTSGIAGTPSFVRAQGISGNGRVILGSNGSSRGLAWVDGQMYDLYAMAQVNEAYRTNYDGTKAVLGTRNGNAVLWDYRLGADGFTDIGSLRWCDDVPFIHFFLGNLCEQGYTHDDIVPLAGEVPMLPLGISDDGTVITGRAGSFFTGFHGSLWTEATGWMTLANFLEDQGVVEAGNWELFNPLVVSATGSEIFGTASNGDSFRLDIDQVYVCNDGNTQLTGWPNATATAVENGAELGRCELLD
jgi:hypothetical protein